MTATPWRLSKKEGFDHLFNHLVTGPPTQELIEGGFLVPTIVRHPRGKLIEGHGANISGDFSESATWENNDKVLLVRSGIDWLLRERNKNSRTVCYTLNVVHAYSVNNYALNKGLKSLSFWAKRLKLKESKRLRTSRMES